MALLCAGLLLFFSLFGRVSNNTVYLEWEHIARVVDGREQTAPELRDPTLPLEVLAEGDCYRMSTTLRPTTDARLVLDVAGMELTLRLDGTVLYRSAAPAPAADISGLASVSIPLPNGAANRTLTLDCRPLSGEMGLSRPLPRLVNSTLSAQSDMAYANYYGIPAGILGMAFLLICFLFAVRILLGMPDWSLPALALAIAAYLLHQLAGGFGTLFLPAQAVSALSSNVFSAAAPLLFLAYILLNRRLFFWKRLGLLTLFAAAALAAAWMISLLQGGYLAFYLSALLTDLFEYGIYSSLLYWLSLYLLTACSLIAAHGVLEALSTARADAKALAIKANLAEQSYYTLEQHNQETAQLRHEMKNHFAALSLLYQKGDMAAVGSYLQQLNRLQSAASPVYFVKNFVVNSILQDAAARAAAAHIRFDVQAALPETLPIPEGDLCSLLMNLLDNAIEAAARVPAERDRCIRFRCHLRQGFLAISCENSYQGPLHTAPSADWPLTTKADPQNHGFGFRQMHAVAEKYHSLLDISYSDRVFTLQTALKLPETRHPNA